MNSNTTEGIAADRWQLSTSLPTDLDAVAPTVEVRVARTIAEVEAIREIWSSWCADRDSDIDFCLNFVWSAPEFIRPHVIVVYRDGRPDAMFVGRVERTKIVSRIGYLKLPGMRARVLMFATSGFLGNTSPENSEIFVKSILDDLKRKQADAAFLQEVHADSPIFQSARSLPGIASRDHVLQPAPHSLLTLSENSEQVWLSLSSGVRADVRRKKKKLLREFGAGAKVHCFREPRELESAIPQVEAIAKKTYQRALNVGFRDTEQIRRRLQFLAEQGWLRMYLLTLNDEPSAFWVGTVYQGGFSSDYLAFDPKFGEFSPGMFLLSEVIDELCHAAVGKLNFGAGESRYKERFSNCHWTESPVYIFGPGLKGIALNCARTAVGLVDNAVKKGLARTRLLPAVKRLWRSRLTGRAD
jgi:hypothetical protein